ncbi:MAG: hypothetical protein R2942_02585 [Ignavibacteria bacterium]
MLECEVECMECMGGKGVCLSVCRVYGVCMECMSVWSVWSVGGGGVSGGVE